MVHDLFSEIDHKIITKIVIDIPLKKKIMKFQSFEKSTYHVRILGS